MRATEGRAVPQGPPPRAARRRETGARAWWVVHQWVGLKLAILMSFVLLTGTLAVFSNEIDWLLRPAMRVDPATVEGPTDFAAVAAGVAGHAPGAEITLVYAPIDRGFAADVIIITEEGRRRHVYVHPTTGVVQGEGSWVGAQRILRDVHRHLMLPLTYGVPIVGSMAVLLLISLATSFVVYKKWWRGFFRLPRSRDARTWMGDFHRLAGLWSLWFVALMIATGLWYFVEEVAARAPPHPSVDVPGMQASAGQLAELLPASLAAARDAYPELKIDRVVFPTTRNGAFQIEGHAQAILVRPRSNAVWVEALTGDAKLVRDGRDLNVHQRISEMADPLHFGVFGGLVTKIIWFVFGATLTALSLSGAAIFSLRILKQERKPSRIGGVAAAAWRGMGPWRWPALALVALCLALTPIYAAMV